MSTTSSIDARQVLKAYNISSLNPKKWHDTSDKKRGPSRRPNRYSVLQDTRLEGDEDIPRPVDAVEDEQDPLRVINGGIFKY